MQFKTTIHFNESLNHCVNFTVGQERSTAVIFALWDKKWPFGDPKPSSILAESHQPFDNLLADYLDEIQ